MKRARIDNNQKEIVSALRRAGAGVLSIADKGNGAPDIVVGFRGENYFIEIKNPNTSYGKKGAQENQKAFALTWPGKTPQVAYSIADCFKILNINQKP